MNKNLAVIAVVVVLVVSGFIFSNAMGGSCCSTHQSHRHK